MEITLNETQSKITKRIEVIYEDRKVNVNLTINNGKIENLNGNIMPVEQTDGMYMEGISFHSYKREEKWYTNVNGASNEEHDYVTDLAIAVVDKVVAEYEVA